MTNRKSRKISKWNQDKRLTHLRVVLMIHRQEISRRKRMPLRNKNSPFRYKRVNANGKEKMLGRQEGSKKRVYPQTLSVFKLKKQLTMNRKSTSMVTRIQAITGVKAMQTPASRSRRSKTTSLPKRIPMPSPSQ